MRICRPTLAGSRRLSKYTDPVAPAWPALAENRPYEIHHGFKNRRGCGATAAGRLFGKHDDLPLTNDTERISFWPIVCGCRKRVGTDRPDRMRKESEQEIHP